MSSSAEGIVDHLGLACQAPWATIYSIFTPNRALGATPYLVMVKVKRW